MGVKIKEMPPCVGHEYVGEKQRRIGRPTIPRVSSVVTPSLPRCLAETHEGGRTAGARKSRGATAMFPFGTRGPCDEPMPLTSAVG